MDRLTNSDQLNDQSPKICLFGNAGTRNPLGNKTNVNPFHVKNNVGLISLG